MTVAEAFNTFKSNLEITQSESQDASRKQKEVRALLNDTFAIDQDFLTGSYARHTKTRPLKDVDIFLVLNASESHRMDDEPKVVLEAVRACLAVKYGAENVKVDRRCVTVNFDSVSTAAGEDDKVLTFDVVPAFEIKGAYKIPDAKSNSWIMTDPAIHAQLSTAKNAELNAAWVPLVKMIRRWNRNADRPIKPSFLIEVMALDLVDRPFGNYPDEIRRFFAAAASTIADRWPDPAGLGPDVSDEMSSSAVAAAEAALRKAELQAMNAQRAENLGRIGDALGIWKSVFGRYFPTS